MNADGAGALKVKPTLRIGLHRGAQSAPTAAPPNIGMRGHGVCVGVSLLLPLAVEWLVTGVQPDPTTPTNTSSFYSYTLSPPPPQLSPAPYMSSPHPPPPIRPLLRPPSAPSPAPSSAPSSATCTMSSTLYYPNGI